MFLLRFNKRQIDCEFRELTFYTGNKYFSVMCFNHLINEIQSEAESESSVPVVAFLILGTSLLT